MQLERGRGWRYGLACAGLLLMVAGLWWWRRGAAPSSPPEAERAARSPSRWTQASSDEPAPALSAVAPTEDGLPQPIPATGVSDAASRAAAVEKLDETIRIYRETMRYPLSSRPADGSNAHLTHWNKPISVGQPFAVDAAKREIRADAQIDQIFAAPGEPIAVTITATYVDDGSPAQLEAVGAEVQWRERKATEPGQEWVSAHTVPLVRDGQIHRGAFIASQVEALRAPIREARVLAFVRVGEFEREFPLDFIYAIQPPVVVHGLRSDRVVDGSLELGLEVDLATAAPVALNATLFGGDGTTAIAVYDDRYFPKRAGRQIIPVQVFGKILHDKKLDGPYRLGAIHGYVFRKDLQPDQLFFDRAEAPVMKTAAHLASAFSADAYQSPEVAARIAHYETLREAMRQGQPPPPPPPALGNPSRP
jgi:hypothetical protein